MVFTSIQNEIWQPERKKNTDYHSGLNTLESNEKYFNSETAVTKLHAEIT